jgi:hypothetical protein
MKTEMIHYLSVYSCLTTIKTLTLIETCKLEEGGVTNLIQHPNFVLGSLFFCWEQLKILSNKSETIILKSIKLVSFPLVTSDKIA